MSASNTSSSSGSTSKEESSGGWMDSLFGSPMRAASTVGGVAAIAFLGYLVSSSLSSEDPVEDETEETADGKGTVVPMSAVSSTLSAPSESSGVTKSSGTSDRGNETGTEKKSSSSSVSFADDAKKSSTKEKALAAESSNGTGSEKKPQAPGGISAKPEEIDFSDLLEEDASSSHSSKKRGKKKNASRGKKSNSSGDSLEAQDSDVLLSDDSAPTHVNFPPKVGSNTVRYENQNAGVCFDYPNHWIREDMKLPNMPVKFNCRPKGVKKSDALGAPTVIFAVDRLSIDSFSLQESVDSVIERLGRENQRGNIEYFDTRPLVDDGKNQGPKGALLCHRVNFEGPGAEPAFFIQYTFLVVHGSKSVSLQYVVHEPEEKKYLRQLDFFRSLLSTVVVAETALRLDLSSCDRFTFTDPENGLKLQYPSFFSFKVKPDSHTRIQLERADENENSDYLWIVNVMAFPLIENASLDSFVESAKTYTQSKFGDGASVEYLATKEFVLGTATADQDAEPLGPSSPGSVPPTPFEPTVRPIQGLMSSGMIKFGAKEKDWVEMRQVYFIDSSDTTGFLMHFSAPRADFKDQFWPVAQFILNHTNFDESISLSTHSFEAPDVLQHFESWKNNVKVCEFDIPATWNYGVESGTGSIVASFVNVESNNADDQLHAQLFVHFQQKPDSVKSTKHLDKWLKTQISEQFPLEVSWGNSVNTTLGEHNAREIVAEADFKEYQVRMLFRSCIVGDKIWYLQYACLNQEWSSSSENAREIFDSFVPYDVLLYSSKSSASSSGSASTVNE